jgi:small conductance mechanosensitive channel
MDEEIEQLQVISNAITQYLIDNGLQILFTLIILAVGYVIAKNIGKAAESLMIGKNIDITLSRFVGNSAHLVTLVFVIMMVLSRLGISVTPLIAIVGALSLEAGLAWLCKACWLTMPLGLQLLSPDLLLSATP